MLAIKAKYEKGRIELLEPIPAEVETAELNIVVIPSKKKNAPKISADEFIARTKTSEEEFKQIGLAAFFDNDNDADIDWEDYFGLK
ncbi:MAG TPA: hypothetical protein ENI91_01065 [Sphingomonadales bacterium]|nr:hypothetical protein [Sphingomonadales bacterium]